MTKPTRAPRCPAFSVDSHRCQRKANHDGEHSAAVADSVYVWTDDPKTRAPLREPEPTTKASGWRR